MKCPTMQESLMSPWTSQVSPIHEISDNELHILVDLIYELSGVSIGVHKRELVSARIRKRLYTLGFSSFHEYIALLSSESGKAEIIEFIDAMTTNTTQFFREPHHFDILRRCVSTREDLKVWSAGCSSGNEAYSIGMVLADCYGDELERFCILGTDISQRMVKKAERGVYSCEEIDPYVSPSYKVKYLMRGKGIQLGRYRIVPELRQRVVFERKSLLDGPGAASELYNVIFCRNVLIYFDQDLRKRLVAMFNSCLVDGGYLFIGHSETLTGLSECFSLVVPTVYRKAMSHRGQARRQ